MRKQRSYSFKPFCTKEVWIMLGFLFITTFRLYGQDQNLADSLELVYTSGQFEEKERLQILSDLAFIHPNPEKSLQFSEELLHRAKDLDSTGYIVGGYLQKGNSLKLKGDLSQALENYLQGVTIATSTNKKRELGLLYLSIASVYQVMGNHKNTIRYYKNAIPIFEEVRDTLKYASALENLGDYYNLALAKPDSALLFFEQSGAIFEARNSKIGIAYNLGNKGLAYAQLGQNIIAENNIKKAIGLLEELGDFYPISVYLTYMADIFAERGDLTAAFLYAERSLVLAQQYGLKDQISDANLTLSELYEKKGDADTSLKFYKVHIAYKDSVKNVSTVQQMANLQMERKEIELNLLNQERKTQKVINIAIGIALFLIGLLAFGLYRRNRFIRKTKQIIERERDRSESLLHNILPQETAEELKKNGKVAAKKFESVTVLFTDFKGFTHYAENLSPEKLVESVGFYFSKFDDIMEKYGLEKIKTVGDAYMCAGGLPFETKDHALKMVQAAFEIKDFVAASKEDKDLIHTTFDIRIGINTGPVVAGVVGTKKFSYDIWGDTVNVASRMETMSEPGKINISNSTYELIKSDFDCEYRGAIEAKNRGKVKMYFVNGIKNANLTLA
ncbi:adenylate/guanylate cyclase domain-containing protein [Maribacter halichondriae]|uniref:adenylate/guanylate cyclase domain-containing protein n=1 Tax=Maribacter halichondriae TaxID=2980554 RepID=UPI002359B5E1|nr:adenylate/guanylate cyclase domain-containing protein [Maribacter sp. Hal144]